LDVSNIPEMLMPKKTVVGGVFKIRRELLSFFAFTGFIRIDHLFIRKSAISTPNGVNAFHRVNYSKYTATPINSSKSFLTFYLF